MFMFEFGVGGSKVMLLVGEGLIPSFKEFAGEV